MTPPASTSDAAPVKPRMILRLGVVGNQYFGWDNGATKGKEWAVNENPMPMRDEVKARCREVYEEVLRCMGEIHDRDKISPFPASEKRLAGRLFGWTSFVFGTGGLWDSKKTVEFVPAFTAEPPELQILTGLGEGVDEIAAAATAGLNCSVLLVSHSMPNGPALALDIGGLLPKPQPSTNVQKREDARGFAGIESERKAVLRAQSAALRHHGDVLLAIWDPDADAMEAGTVESVRAALSENIPVIAVRLGLSGKGAAGHIQILKHERDLQLPPSSNWKVGLAKALTQILEFPNQQQSKHPGDEDHTEYNAVAAYQRFVSDEGFPRSWPGVFWHDMLALTKEAEMKALKDAPSGKNPAPNLPNRDLSVAMKRAQEMSQAFGEAHRGGILLSYSLAGLAVVLAVVGHLSGCYLPMLPKICCGLEVVAVLLMALLAFHSKWQDWHNAYTDARLLAEALRMMEFLWPLGQHTPIPKLPHYLKKHDHLRLPQQPWTVWYFRALVRMLPLHGGSSSAANNTGNMAKHLSEDWIAHQISHHAQNSARHGHIHYLAELFRYVFFGLAVVAVLLHAVHKFSGHQGEHWCWMPGEDWLFFFCVCMPAAIAAVHGAASQLESNRLHLRSKSLMEMLESSKERLDEVASRQITTSADYRFVKAEALNAASLMIDETAGWSLLYKNAPIPAG